MDKNTTTQIRIGNEVTLDAISEWEGMYRMDTEIRIEGKVLCVISGPQYQDFLDALNKVVDKYRI